MLSARKILPLIIGLVLTLLPPAPVQAASSPVDLELGGEGATPWSINNIKPGDSGTKTVTLRNVGSKDGLVTIWVTGIVSTEGQNPESETGNTAEPGELDLYLKFNLTAAGLTTNLNLPTIIGNLPSSATASDFIDIIPLKSGTATDIVWAWELPAPAGNDAQGDGISFTINYLLRECAITDVSGVVNTDGVFTQGVTVNSGGGQGKLTISQGTKGKTKENQPLSDIWIIELDREKPPPPANKTSIGFYYEVGPEGATFDQPVTITFTYKQEDVPHGVNEKDLVIALWNENLAQWVELGNCTVDTANNTISAQISHFSRYTIIAPAPTPAPAPPSGPAVPPPPTGEEALPPKTLEVDILGKTSKVEIGADGTLAESLTLTDRAGDFTLDIGQGTKIVGAGLAELGRIELRITEASIVVPENMIALSPVYELRGYTRDMEVTGISFSPPATLTIRYNPESLPENSLLPGIANYTDEKALVRLPSPPGTTVEIGEAKALISHASLFVVVAEVLPPPPLLPARFVVSNLIVTPKQAQLGETITITFTVTNEGATAGSTELYLIIDGAVRVVKEVTLGASSSETLTFEVSNLAQGTHQVKIAGLAEQFKVVMVPTPPGEPGVNWLVIDLSVAAALALGALVLYFLIRRARQRA